jgi:RNA polymerase sigma factor for flagellar operon FliA
MSPPLSDEQAARVARHTELVLRVAHAIHRQIELLDVDELASVGNEALVGAAMRYDPTSGASFSTYAYYRIRGAMLDALRSAKPAGRRTIRARVRLEQCQALLREASEDQRVREIAGRSTLEQRVATARELLRKAAMISVMSECQGATVDRIDDAEPDPESQLLDHESRRRAASLIDELEPTERRLVAAIYQTGQTMAEYAAEKGTSSATISRRHAKIVERLAKRARARE